MQAIRITEENLSKIRETELISPSDLRVIRIYLNRKEEWYFVRSYIPSDRGPIQDYALLPRYILDHNFEIDFDHAAHDFDEIVRN